MAKAKASARLASCEQRQPVASPATMGKEKKKIRKIRKRKENKKFEKK